MTTERIGSPEQRREGWPKECQESWAETFARWAAEGTNKTLTPNVIAAIAHTLQCNLDYIDELEETTKARDDAITIWRNLFTAAEETINEMESEAKERNGNPFLKSESPA